MTLAESDVRELKAAIVAHSDWMLEQGVKLPGHPLTLTAIDVFCVLEDAKREKSLKDPTREMAVFESLIDLIGLHEREVGLKRVKANLDARWAKRVDDAPRAEKAAMKRQRRAVLAVHEDSQLKIIEARAALFRKNGRSLLRALAANDLKIENRYRALQAAEFDAIAEPTAIREHLESMWIKAQVGRALFELDQYLQRARGAVTSDSLGHPGEATSAAWNALRGKCLADLEASKIPGPLRRRLFASSDTDPERERNLERKRRGRAKKKASSAS